MSFVSNSTGAFFDRSIAQMRNLRESAESLQTSIATGVQFQRGSDDPVAASRLRALTRLEVRGETEQENAARLEQDLSEAANQIGGVVDVLQRVRELSVAAASDTLGEDGREAIANELDQLFEEVFARSNSLSLTDAPLFAGTGGAPAFTLNPDGSVTYNGNGEVGTVPVAPGTDIERGVTGEQVFEFEVNGTPTNTFAVIADLAAAMRVGGAVDPSQAAQDALLGIDSAIDNANRSQTVIGTRLAWVESIQQDQQNRAIDVAEKRSDIADTDLADTIVRLQQTLTALEASQTSFTRVSNLNLFNVI